jgi:sigma-B regulation protein RsbU (phosphoserine phosphatase)
MDSGQRMQATGTPFDESIQQELVARLETLRRVSLENGQASGFARFIEEVDAAFKRYEEGTYGICETCSEPMNVETMLADPLARVCLDELTGKQKTALEDDLQFAAEIQRGLLPSREITHGRWSVDFVYEPAGIISGDYCDVIASGDDLYFILGDVSGKGMAASLLMSNLHAIFHSLVPLGLGVAELMERANRLLLKSSLSNQFATLVCGKVAPDGAVEIANAGHLPPFVVSGGAKTEIEPAGLPLGLFTEAEYETQNLQLAAGDCLLLFTDGVTEAMDAEGLEFGAARLADAINGGSYPTPTALVSKCSEHVAAFRGTADRHDDLTMLALSFS